MRGKRSSSEDGRAIRGSAMLSLLALAGSSLFSGCTMPELQPPQTDSYAYSRLAAPYRTVKLKTSTTLDVLSLLESPTVRVEPGAAAAQLLTQSDAAVGLSGKSTDGWKIWVNVIAFDEYRMTARRKYFFLSDERPTPPADTPSANPIPGALVFDAQFMIDPEVGTVLYATDEARKAAIVRSLAERFAGDVRRLAGSSAASSQADAMVATAGLMMNQVFQGVLGTLDKSSALAKDLSTEQGIAFGHMSLGEGRIRLLVTEGIGTVAIRINQPMPPLPAS
jgi:hypothetical protein